MPVEKGSRYPTADGLGTYHCRTWAPDQGTPVATIQLVHGISEHIGRYEHLARFLTEQGFFVAAEDHLGHGETPEDPKDLGYTADADGWVKMTDNVYDLHRRVKARYPDLPCAILGHSMGSFLTRSYLIRYPGTVDACVLMGTGQQNGAVLKAGLAACALERARLGKRGRSKLLQSLCFGAYNKQFEPCRTPSDWVCSSEEVVDAYVADPLCQVMPTVTLMRDMLWGIQFEQRRENLAKMDKTTPVLFLSGERDPVGGNGKGVRLAYRSFLDAGCTDVTMELYPGDRHEIHNGVNRDAVYQRLLGWLREKLSL